MAILALAGLAGAGSALGATPHWRLDSRSAPTILPLPGQKAVITAEAANLGEAEITGTKTIADVLPAGFTAVGIDGHFGTVSLLEGEAECSLKELSCTTAKPIPPYGRLEVEIEVENTSAGTGTVTNEVEVAGGETVGGAPMPTPPPLLSEFKVAGTPTAFGIEKYEFAPENEDGSLDTVAGSHPFQLTTTIDFDQTLEQTSAHLVPSVPSLVKNLHLSLPPGLLGDPNAVAQCSDADFSSVNGNAENRCPSDTVIGVAVAVLGHPMPPPGGRFDIVVPVFNLTPERGEPARFGFEAFDIPVIFDTAVRAGGDYGVDVNVHNVTEETNILVSSVTLWGEPGLEVHDQSRGWGCNGIYGEPERCTPPEQRSTTPFLTMPTSCTGTSTTLLEDTSWAGDFAEQRSELSALQGCEGPPFSPSIAVQPIGEAGEGAAPTTSANTPTGLRVDLKLPQQETTLAAGALGEADVKDSTVTLPEGVQLSPAAANGLEACSMAQVGYIGPAAGNDPFSGGAAEPLHFSTEEAHCPAASKVGVVHINTPLLSHELIGGVYLAAQDANPFGSTFALYIVAEDEFSGVRVKLAGKVEPNPVTGQLTTTFENTPQTPFEDLKLEFFGGPHASVTTPPSCGTYTATSALTPWTAPFASAQTPSGAFAISSGAGGGPCGSPLAPSFQAGSGSLQAGGYTNFTVNVVRPDADQALSSLAVTLPPGLAGILPHVKRCDEADANAGTCPPESRIGTATASAGLGPGPFTETGQVFLTEKYDGAPFGLSIVTPTAAGPFNFGNLIVRSTINVNPTTAALTITSALPTMINTATHQTGVPTQLKAISVTVDHPEFQFNPTSCAPMHVTATFTGVQGGSATETSPFQVANCSKLKFAPKLTASAAGHASKANGTSFNVNIKAAGLGQANIAKVDLQLPIALPSRLSTIQKACLASVFEANPAACDEGSLIGRATIHTPVLASPLSGPAYLVSHGGAAFPDVEFVLQGEGVTIILDGKTQITKGITYSRFESAPDAPFTSFETVLPAGPHSALTANVPESKRFNLCGTNLEMPTIITAQNGAVIKQETKIAVLGCAKPLTNKQLMSKALATCKKAHKHSKKKRAACERQARKKYGPKKAKTNAKKK